MVAFICVMLMLIPLLALYLLIGFLFADMWADWEEKKRGSDMLFWPWRLCVKLWNCIRGESEGWRW